jgi:predicted ATP-binding protein involved in virulence
MYIDSVSLRDVKCFKDIKLEFQTAAQTQDRQSNWNVILGDNGDGKTTLLQAIAVCLMDAATAQKLLDPNDWVRHGQGTAQLTAKLRQEEGDKQQPGRPVKDPKSDYTVQYLIVDAGQEIGLEKGSLFETPRFFPTATILEPASDYGHLFGPGYESVIDDMDFIKRSALAKRTRSGWHSCGYGAFRRISGFSTSTAEVDVQLQKRFLTLFEEGAALYDVESWLKELDRKAKKSRKDSVARKSLKDAIDLICKLLPEVSEIKVQDQVKFIWQGNPTSLNQLSDGYRSMFALVVDLLRWLELSRPDINIPLNEVRGVVLIDEIDAHLHPKWQRQVGFWLTEFFPNIQFIVASHSPFVAMAAGEGALTLLQKEGNVVRANQDVPYVRGWAVGQVLTSLFDMISLRDPETAKLLEEYEELLLAHRAGKLKPAQEEELAKLENDLNARMSGSRDAPEQRKLEQDLVFFAGLLREKRTMTNAQDPTS